MAKKAIHIVLTLFLMLSTTGFTVSSHYCGSHLVDISINATPDSCNAKACCSDCCHNETHHFQLKEEYNKTIDVDTPAPMSFIVPIIYLVLDTGITPTESFIHTDFNPPPPRLSTRLSLHQCYLN